MDFRVTYSLYQHAAELQNAPCSTVAAAPSPAAHRLPAAGAAPAGAAPPGAACAGASVTLASPGAPLCIQQFSGAGQQRGTLRHCLLVSAAAGGSAGCWRRQQTPTCWDSMRRSYGGSPFTRACNANGDGLIAEPGSCWPPWSSCHEWDSGAGMLHSKLPRPQLALSSRLPRQLWSQTAAPARCSHCSTTQITMPVTEEAVSQAELAEAAGPSQVGAVRAVEVPGSFVRPRPRRCGSA